MATAGGPGLSLQGKDSVTAVQLAWNSVRHSIGSTHSRTSTFMAGSLGGRGYAVMLYTTCQKKNSRYVQKKLTIALEKHSWGGRNMTCMEHDLHVSSSPANISSSISTNLSKRTGIEFVTEELAVTILFANMIQNMCGSIFPVVLNQWRMEWWNGIAE